jgi:putative inorganic carbon (HCO3(-)) transporter
MSRRAGRQGGFLPGERSRESIRLTDLLATVGPMGVLAIAGASFMVVMTTMRPLIGYTLIAGMIAAAVAYVSGNVRTLSIWGLGLTATLEFSKYFKVAKHQGGEYAFRAELSDPFIIILGAYLILDMAREGRWHLRVSRAAWCWFALIVMTIFSMLFGEYRLVASMEVVRSLKVLALWLVIANVLVRKRQIEHLAAALLVGLAIQSFFGLGQYFFGLKLGFDRLGEADFMAQDLGGTTRRRIGAFLGHPNILSCYLAMIMPIALAALFSRVSAQVKIAVGATLGAAAIALVLALSRNGWASFAAAAAIVVMATMLHGSMRRRTHMLRLALIAGAMLVLLFGSGRIIERLTRSDPMSVGARWEINRIAFRMVLAKPILGFGKNSTAYVMTRGPEYRLKHIREVSHNPENIPPIHNIYIQQWAEQGTIGLIIFLGMLGLVLKAGVENLKTKDENMYALSAAASAGCVAIMIHGTMDWVFWWNAITRTYFVLAGIVFAIKYWRITNEEQGPEVIDTEAWHPAMSGGKHR